MSDHFTKAVRAELSEAQDRIRNAINRLTSDAISARAYGGDRVLVSFQTAIIEEIRGYTDILVKRLTLHDVHHTPIALADFDAAIKSIDDLRAAGLAIYEKKLLKGGPWGMPQLSFDMERLERAVAKAKVDIEGHKNEFASNRSFGKRFWQRAEEDISHKIVALVLAAIAVIGALVWALIRR